MHSHLSGPAVLVLTTLAAATLTGCQSDAAPSTTPASATATSSESPAPGRPAVVLPKNAGVFTSCVIAVKGDGDYLWSGTQFKARANATLEAGAPANLTNMHVVGTWIAEDAKDDGIFAAWKRAGKFVDMLGQLTPAKGAALEAGTTYRLVLRLRPDALPAEANSFDVTWSTADGQSDTITDATVLQVAASDRDC